MPNLPIELADIACGHKGMISHIAFSPNGQNLASTSLDSSLRIWEISDFEHARAITAHSFNITAVAWSPRGDRVATVSDDRSTMIWKYPGLSEISKFEEHPRGITRLAWSPDDADLITCSNDRRIRVFAVADQTLKTMLEGHVSLPRCIVFAPGGKFLASGSEGGTLRLWDIPSYKEFGAFYGHRAGINQIAWMDSHRLATASDDGSIRIWNISQKLCTQVLLGHDGPVKGVSFSSCGRLMATKSWDQTLRLWSTEHWQTVAILEEDTAAPFPNLSFSPKSPLLASIGGVDRVVRLWRLDIDVLAAAPPATQVFSFREIEQSLLQARGMDDLVSTPPKPKKNLKSRYGGTSELKEATTHVAMPQTAENTAMAPEPRVDKSPAPDLRCDKCGESITAGQIQRRQSLGFDFINCPVCETRVTLAPGGQQTLGDWAGARKLILAVMFTDIVASSALANRLGNQGMREVRHQHFERVRQSIREHKGYEVKTIGDAFMAAFKTVAEGLNCALDVIRKTGHAEVEIRAALHVGPVEIEEHDLFGNMVNFCSRLMGEAGAAELCVSEETRSHVIQEGDETHLALNWRDCDNVSFKGFPGTWRVWLLS